MNIVRLESVGSTNDYIREHADELASPCAVVSDYQTAGRGQGSNTWHSEAGKNLTFSIFLKTKGVKATRQFVFSKAIALAVADALDEYAEGISVKWPNDIYWNDSKISGTLIECAVAGDKLRHLVIGTGVNINEEAFPAELPNPVSLRQIVGHEVDRDEVLGKILENLEGYAAIIEDHGDDFIGDYYGMRLYRGFGMHRFKDADGELEAEIADVEADGHLVLRLADGTERRYGFKEVEFLLS